MLSSKPRGRVYYGWWIVLTCAVLHLYSGATYFYGFTAFFNPIVEEFSWTYALVSFAVTLRSLEAGFLAPLVGILVDKLGARKLMVLGNVIAALGFLLFSITPNLLVFYAASLILAIGLSLTSSVVSMTVVAKWFRRQTTLAMGLLMTGFAAGGLLVPAVVWLIDRFEWRNTFVIFGIGALLLCTPLSLLVKEPPEEKIVDSPGPSPQPNEKPKRSFTREVMRKRDFWLLSIAVFFSGIAGLAILVHQIPYLVSVGVSRQTAGFMAIIFAVGAIMGRLLFGWLGDRIDKRYCFAIASGVQAIGILAFTFFTAPAYLAVSLAALGLGFSGTIPLRPALQADLFGRQSFGSIQGLLMVFVTLGNMIAPPFAGWVFDISKDYQNAFIVFAISALVAIPIILMLPRRKQPNNSG